MALAPPHKVVLPGGLTVLLLEMPERRSVSAGAWLRGGARDEPRPLMGVSHFLEHLLFKGTERRSARDIAGALESVGGHLDAYTTREYVCYHARCLSEHLPLALDVLADLVAHATLSDLEIEREKSVVHEEIQSYEDNPEEKAHELLGRALWGEDPLGWPILGTAESISGLPGESVRAFYRERYRSESLVVSIAGRFETKEALALVTRAFDVTPGDSAPSAGPPGARPPEFAYEAKDTAQLQIVLGRPALPHGHPDRPALAVLNAILGGGMSSRLFQSVREEAALAYSVFSGLETYRDTGLLSISLGVRPERGGDALARVVSEMERLLREGPTALELESGRAQLSGGLVLAQESVSQHMTHLAVDEICHGRVIPLEERLERIARVGPEDMARLSAEYLVPGRFTLAGYGPREAERLLREAWRVASEPPGPAG
jgi:predicted Zn-dependent peptidase